MKVSAQYAESHLAELLSAAKSGEEVEIAQADHTSFRLSVVSRQLTNRAPRVLGAGRGELRVPSEEDWSEIKRELERRMNDAPLLSSDEI